MGSRQISGLIWAKLCTKPGFAVNSRARGKKAAGLRYERQLAAAIPGAVHGQWFEFEDFAGKGWCQPDLFIKDSGAIFVLEAKYTWKRGASKQISGLYKPVLEHVFGLPVRGIVVCKVLTSETPRGAICHSLEEAKSRALGPWPVVLHWVGVGLEPFRPRAGIGHLAPGLASL